MTTTRPEPSQPAPEVDAVLEALRASGARITAPRRAVVETLVASPRDLSAEDIADELSHHEPPIHLSTVYRTLEALEDAGVITHAHLGHGRAVYQITGSEPIHAECDTCGLLVELPVDALDALAADLRTEVGFELHMGHFSLLGRCGPCRAAVGATPHRHGRR